jgi:branched-chain amino acid transport system substrate-binding protein
MINKNKICIYVFLILLVVLVSCNKAENTIKVGVIVPLTGPLAKYGEDMKIGFEIAINEIMDKGGINGKQIELIYEDVTCLEVKQATTALNKLTAFDEIRSILGSFCGHIIRATAEFSNANNIFAITSGDNFGKIGKYTISTRYLLDKEAKLLADYALSQNWKKLAILYLNNDWGIGYKDGIKKHLEEKGGKLIAAESYFWDNLDVRTQLIKIRDKNPDALVIIDGTAKGLIFKQIKELGIELPLLSEWQIEDWDIEPDVVQSSLEGTAYARQISGTSSFNIKFKSLYGKEPTTITLDSYDAAMILSKALENCEKENYDAQCMTDYVTSLKDYQGAGGKLTFDKETWSFDKPFQLKTVKNGQFVVLKDIN